MGSSQVQLALTPGLWEVLIQDFLDGELYAEGIANVELKAGVNSDIGIRMLPAGIAFTVDSIAISPYGVQKAYT